MTLTEIQCYNYLEVEVIVGPDPGADDAVRESSESGESGESGERLNYIKNESPALRCTTLKSRSPSDQTPGQMMYGVTQPSSAVMGFFRLGGAPLA